MNIGNFCPKTKEGKPIISTNHSIGISRSKGKLQVHFYDAFWGEIFSKQLNPTGAVIYGNLFRYFLNKKEWEECFSVTTGRKFEEKPLPPGEDY